MADQSSTGDQLLDVSRERQARQAVLLDADRTQLQLLARVTADLALLSPKDDIYTFAAKKLCELVPGAIVILSEWTADGQARVCAVEGLGERARVVLELIGRDLVGMTFAPLAARVPLRDDFVPQRMDGAIHELTSGLIPAAVGRAVEKLLPFGPIYSVDIGWAGRTSANAALALGKGETLRHPDLVGLFLRHVAATIQRRRVEVRLRIAAQLGSDLIYERKIETDTLEWFGRVDEALGYEENEIPRTIEGWVQLIHPDDQLRLKNAVERQRTERQMIHYVFRVRHKDGEWRTWEDKSLPVLGEDGLPHKWIGVCTDITERTRAERERQRLEAQFCQAQKLESLGVLAGGIAHDFNNLLTGVLANAEIALMDLPPEAAARECVTAIITAARRSADLAKQMLAYSGKGRFLVESLELRTMVREMSALLEVSISRKIAIGYRLGSAALVVDADAPQLRQVVMNLITNAADAIGDDNGVITIAAGSVSCDADYLKETHLGDELQAGDFAFIEVSDTGAGMDGETIAKMFDPFFTTKFTGRGLGLAAVLGIVRGHGGAINIHSELGEGTSIKVLLPLVKGDASRATERPGEAERFVGSGTILVVDDEELVRAATQRILSRSGFDVLLANDGCEAVEMFKERQDDIRCVLLDMTMPRMDGAQCFRELKRIDPNVRVILISGYNEQESTDRSPEGYSAFIQKPFRIATLAETIHDVLSNEGVAD